MTAFIGFEAANINQQSPATTSEASVMPVKEEPVITTRKNYSNAKPMPLRSKTENDLVSDLYILTANLIRNSKI